MGRARSIPTERSNVRCSIGIVITHRCWTRLKTLRANGLAYFVTPLVREITTFKTFGGRPNKKIVIFLLVLFCTLHHFIITKNLLLLSKTVYLTKSLSKKCLRDCLLVRTISIFEKSIKILDKKILKKEMKLKFLTKFNFPLKCWKNFQKEKNKAL